jgi:DNA-binding NarL/FixJ family response regulator
MTDVRDGESRPRTLVILFAAIAVLMIADMADDLRSAIEPLHLGLELAVVVLAAVGVTALWREVFAARAEARALTLDLRTAQADAERWRVEARDALLGLGDAIGHQFERWELTAAERGVGVLLLRGLSHKEIAQERDTSERTVRQQALAVYRKAGVHSRAELSAYFLAGLPLPQG